LKRAETAAKYREALRVKSNLARAEASAKHVARLEGDGKFSRESLARLCSAMQRQQRPASERQWT
jgi:tellurite resistance protein